MATPSESGIVSIFDTIPAYVFTVDDDVCILDCNKAATSLLSDNREYAVRQLGIEAEYCIQSHQTPKGSGQDPACEDCDIRNSIKQAISGNSVIRKHALLEISREGKLAVIPALITASPQVLEDKKRVTLMIEDLSKQTQLKKAEEDLRLSETNFRKLVEMANEGIWMLDEEFRTVFVNPRMARMLGYEPEEMLGREIHSFVIQNDSEKIATQMNMRKIGSNSKYELRFRRKDAGILWTYVSGSALFDPDGRFTGAFAMISDISERKMIEKELHDSRMLLEKTFASLNESIFIVETGSRKILDCNIMVEKMFGYSREEMIGSSTSNLHVSEEKSQQFGREMLEAYDEKGYYETTFIMKRKNGTVFASEHSVTPIRNDNGKIVSHVCVVRDISERRKSEEALRLAKEVADAANLAKSRFLANMSHEIRTPMNGVIGMTSLLLTTELTEEQRGYAEIVKSSGNTLVRLINDILDLSKIESQRLELEAIAFDLRTTISDTLGLFSPQSEEKGLGFSAVINPDVPHLLKGDEVRLRQIISNLIANAIKFTHQGSISLHISKVAEDKRNSTLHFMVRDSGIGIVPDKLGLIFEPFTQGDGSTTREYGGTGLGLTIARQLALLMGGTIGVESIEGKGSDFWFTAVLAKQTGAAGSPLKSAATAYSYSGAATPGSRLLLADDDLNNQAVIELILKKYGFQVEACSNGKEALQALETGDYDLVLMDCMMPVMSGYQATKVIRDTSSRVRNHSIPVIALTANAFKEDRNLCLEAGMDDYLSKPLEVPKLLALLEKWLKTAKNP